MPVRRPLEAARYPQPEGRAPAPGALAIVQDFANAHFEEAPQPDRERPMEPLAGWFAWHGLVTGDLRLSARDVRQVLAFRDALRSLMEENHGSAPDPAAHKPLNEVASRAPLSVRFEHGAPHLQPAAAGLDAALGRLLAIITDASRDGTWQRLKICRADDCRWAYYDTSKNRSGAWCSMAECGNRAKARAYRQRHRR